MRASPLAWTCLYLAVGAASCSLVVGRELEPRASIAHHERLFGLRYTVDTHAAVLGSLSALAALGLSCASTTRGRALLQTSRGRRFVRGCAAVAIIAAGLAYFYLGRGIAWAYYPWFWDEVHYVLGASYHDELGYDGLYDCIVQADAEGKRVLEHTEWLRDLRTYRLVEVARSRERHDCRSRFTPARFAQFRRDLEPFLLYGRGFMPGVLRDFGYNGTPFRSWLTSKVLEFPALTFRSLTLLALPDIAALTGVLVLVSWGFGVRLGAIFALFLFTSFSDRFEHIGGSYLRYLWLFLLVAGVVLLERRRPAGAAACITASALLNVFPALFLAGPFARMLRALISRRGLSGRERAFALSSLLTALTLTGATLIQRDGLQRYADFARKMTIHAGRDNAARVGLRYVFLPILRTPSDPLAYPVEGRSLGLGDPWFLLVVVALVAVTLAVVSRLDDVEASVLGGVLLLFVGLGTVQYYYACACLLVLLFHRARERGSAQMLLASLFGLNAGLYALLLRTHSPELCDNYATSWMYALFLGGCLVHFARPNHGAVPEDGAGLDLSHDPP